MGSVCHGYMCILLYMKLVFGLVVLHRSMAELERMEVGQSAMGICALCYI